MTKSMIAEGVLHPVPEDMIEALRQNDEITERWNKLTPIQRNEWICWVTLVNKLETREAHIQRMIEELSEGKKQPCCWPGCPHRRPSAQKWFNKLDK